MEYIYLILCVFIAVTFVPFLLKYLSLITLLLPQTLITLFTLAIISRVIIWLIGKAR